MTSHFDNIAVVGVGLIGGSIALAVRQRALAKRVIGVSRTPGALRAFAGTREFPNGLVDHVTDSIEEASARAQLILLCTPPKTIVKLARDAAAAAESGTIITDVASTKRRLISELEASLGNACHFVGAHPLAGSHHSGPAAAREDLFEGCRVIVTPTDETDRSAVEKVSQFWAAMGAEVLKMSAFEHDQRLAGASHLPHIIAAALAAATPADALPLTAGGWRDTTRVAAGDADLWADILVDNQQPVLQAMGKFADTLGEFRAALEDGDRQKLLQYLKEGKERRDALGS